MVSTKNVAITLLIAVQEVIRFSNWSHEHGKSIFSPGAKKRNKIFMLMASATRFSFSTLITALESRLSGNKMQQDRL